MEYLRKYMSDFEINEIIKNINSNDACEISMHEERVEEIIKYLLSKGIDKIKDVFIYNVGIFYSDVNELMDILDKCDEKTLDLIRNDVNNFELLNI